MSKSLDIDRAAGRKTGLHPGSSPGQAFSWPRLALALLAVLAVLAASALEAGAKKLGIGREATAEEIAGWAISVRPDGQGLPAGKGTVKDGEPLYVERCAACHGEFGESAGRWPIVAGGAGTLASHDPVKSVGSYWPYASTLLDYIRRSMPFGAAQSLTNDELYAITAYVLYLNDVIKDFNFELNDKNFTAIRLPNEGNFVDDDREAVRKGILAEKSVHEELRAWHCEGHRTGARDRRDARQRKAEAGMMARTSARNFTLAMAAVLLTVAPVQKIQAAGDKALGAYLSSECVTCHQASGRFDGIPSIVGWPEASFVEIMQQYRTRERANPVMQTIAGKLTEEEIAALAAYFGSLKPAPRAK